MRNLIAAGKALAFEDDDTPGNKHTECSWGLCSKAREAWPDAEDHLFPNRSSPKYRRDPHSCPFSKGKRTTGCFYDCRIFQARRPANLPTRAEALTLYDEAIATYTRTQVNEPDR
jgi:hypothetical protein